ncbi:hypothetical protein OEG84_25050 [Hoeflea sp. G2-23]|uniref:Uncharacterized protein n=1 Tax=Hoeflea algicola TaxID=2983763 RepID=A0ABT3Z2Z3_9HYPH|nr:hypothetical protein [Hoeflea algicola]MCY0146140.1 hypothetical protein [Hoeflea algicola]MCY0150876.1 hypothetical protein [Hoeflea algicola]
MAVLPFPALSFEHFDMRQVNTRLNNTMLGRKTETADFGTPYWRVSAATGFLSDEKIDEADAFFTEASKGGNVFACYDYYRPRPRAYGDTPLGGTKAAGGAFDGSAILSTGTDSRTIVVSGLPDSFALNRGCLVEVNKSSSVRSLHRVMADATANGSGVVTLTIDFPLDTTVFTSGNSTIQLEKPSCLMMLDPGWSMPKAWSDRVASFSATEVFL